MKKEKLQKEGASEEIEIHLEIDDFDPRAIHPTYEQSEKEGERREQKNNKESISR